MINMKNEAELWARELHEGQLYGGLPYYDAHIAKVKHKLIQLGLSYDRELLDAADLHDSVEDVFHEMSAKLTLLDRIRERFGDGTADIVWAVTGIGRNRKERNASAYAKIAVTPKAALLKYADRFINIQHSAVGSSHYTMYQKEHPGFMAVVGPHLPVGWDEAIDALFSQ
jgi:(p)ppGpp synthase/HD superfamily hydrolase